jgi:hypothetical protein
VSSTWIASRVTPRNSRVASPVRSPAGACKLCRIDADDVAHGIGQDAELRAGGPDDDHAAEIVERSRRGTHETPQIRSA